MTKERIFSQNVDYYDNNVDDVSRIQGQLPRPLLIESYIGGFLSKPFKATQSG